VKVKILGQGQIFWVKVISKVTDVVKVNVCVWLNLAKDSADGAFSGLIR